MEAQTLTVWRQADRYQIPRLVYLNKMDKPRASVSICLESLRNKLHVDPLLINVPIGTGKQFVGVYDLINMESLTWNDSKSQDGSSYETKKIKLDGSNKDEAAILKARSDLIGKLADIDESVADLVLCDTQLDQFPTQVLINAVKTATLNHKIIPVFCGSSLKNKGVQPLLDAITFFLPSPMEVNYGFSKYYGSHLCALAFKVIHHKQRGPLTFVRIYSGMLKSGAHVFNINRAMTEKTTKLLQVYADEYHDLSNAVAGNIVAIAGLKQVKLTTFSLG